jgi:hypothetical protein
MELCSVRAHHHFVDSNNSTIMAYCVTEIYHYDSDPSLPGAGTNGCYQ